jgi:uroporphyrinogen-III synthase
VGALAGLRVIAFESRRAVEIARLLERHDAIVIGAPALREVPLEDNVAAIELLAALEAREVDAIVLLTGVGTRALVKVLETRCPRERVIALLRGVPIVARGPKPVAALREIGLQPTVLAPEPNTWRELLAAIDRELPVGGLRVAVQEYGRPNPELLAGLSERGAVVRRVPVYAWALPARPRAAPRGDRSHRGRRGGRRGLHDPRSSSTTCSKSQTSCSVVGKPCSQPCARGSRSRPSVRPRGRRWRRWTWASTSSPSIPSSARSWLRSPRTRGRRSPASARPREISSNLLSRPLWGTSPTVSRAGAPARNRNANRLRDRFSPSVSCRRVVAT